MVNGNNAPECERKSFKFNLEQVDESGQFSGYASVFDVIDDGNDVVEKGAFVKTIAADFNRIKILSQHDSYDLPIGKPLELREDNKGLFIKGKISDTQKGRDIITLLKDGVLNELSIGYDAVVCDVDEKGIRHLKEIKLWEISIVTWAMNDQATIDEVKALTEELKLEAKSGKISRSRLEALKPFIAVVRELVDILGPFLEPQPQENPPQEKLPECEDPAEPPKSADDTADDKKAKKQTKNKGIIFEIVP